MDKFHKTCTEPPSAMSGELSYSIFFVHLQQRRSQLQNIELGSSRCFQWLKSESSSQKKKASIFLTLSGVDSLSLSGKSKVEATLFVFITF